MPSRYCGWWHSKSGDFPRESLSTPNGSRAAAGQQRVLAEDVETVVRTKRRGGFSLIEIMFATLIFTVAYLAIIGIFPTCARAVHEARVVMLATHIAQQQLENTVSITTGFSGITGGSGQVTLISVVNGATETLTFNWQITVTNPGGDTNLKDVRCQVYWVPSGSYMIVGPSSVSKSVNMETMVANMS